MTNDPEVAVVGLGYVGLTLAVTLAEAGYAVWGYDREPSVVRFLQEGRSHIQEPGVEEVLQSRLGRNLMVADQMPESFAGTIVISVSTPVGPDQAPILDNLCGACETIAATAADGVLVIIRSTIPVGTCRKVVLPILQKHLRSFHLACCPERTIQGRALEELSQLPQVVGGLDQDSADRAASFWKGVTGTVVKVSSLEAAEMVKLINNCHTDLVYSYGNEVAMMAQQLGLDPMELIRAANVEYPRPDLARPGFVAGPCMSKDPYLLLSSLEGTNYQPRLVAEARSLNESLPRRVADHFVQRMQQLAGGLEGAKVLVCGFAYKGWPVTDDVRGTPTQPIITELQRYPIQLYGHDYLVPPDTIRAMGAEYVEDIRQGLDGARGVLFVNEHPDYRYLPMVELAKSMNKPALVYDCWRMFDSSQLESAPDIHYLSVGYG